ncbi:MAG TPA: ATP-grasp domain-containing protein [Candidatus Gracilibacteria bacterium]|nr:ATP-grasp domain-containing protein [Candidatus Gracilibacteria bacterium]
MNKSVLITYLKSFNLNHLKDFRSNLSYKEYQIITHENKVNEKILAKNPKFKVEICEKRKNIPSKIKEIVKKIPRHSLVLPYFSGDSNSKYAIQVYNDTFSTKIKCGDFRIKSQMNNFLGKLSQKKNWRLDYNALQKLTYAEISSQISSSFIVKPINAASSVLNFKVMKEEEWERAKLKLKKKYEYLLEEYLEGNLYSLDFFCDGKNIFLLCFAREIPFAELIEKFSPHYLEKYQTIPVDFLHFLPIRYTLDLQKLSKLELNYVKQLGQKLIEKQYRGFIHLEYKIQRKTGKIGFIEWGARLGWSRAQFIKSMYGVRVENIPHDLLYKRDYRNFVEKEGLMLLKNRNFDKNFIGIKTNVFQKTHLVDILHKIPNYLKVSFASFLKEFLDKTWHIKINSLKFVIKTSSDHCLYPFYERGDTQFSYIMEIEKESFKKFLHKKHRILEKLVFHDY